MVLMGEKGDRPWHWPDTGPKPGLPWGWKPCSLVIGAYAWSSLTLLAPGLLVPGPHLDMLLRLHLLLL